MVLRWNATCQMTAVRLFIFAAGGSWQLRLGIGIAAPSAGERQFLTSPQNQAEKLLASKEEKKQKSCGLSRKSS